MRAALDHKQPDRVPFSWGFGPTMEMSQVLNDYLADKGISWPRIREIAGDIKWVMPFYNGPQRPPHTDIWGIERKLVSYGTGTYYEVSRYPLADAADPSEIEAYPWPDPEQYAFEEMGESIIRNDPEQFRAHKFGIAGNPFEIYSWMTGLEKTMLNVALNPDLVRAALDKVTGYFEGWIRGTMNHCSGLVDIFFFADDLGSQKNLLISRKSYRDILQPFHKRLTDLAKKLAPQAYTMYHSDGAVFDILPDLMDAGFDVLEAVQTEAAGMDPDRLKNTYGDRLSFHGSISVQALLPRVDEETVILECRRLVDILGKGGGFIAAPSHAIQVGTHPQNVLAMLRAVMGEDDYQDALAEAHV